MSATFSVSHLTCEYKTDPIGIDVERPRLSWKLESSQRGVGQSACQVLVATAPALLEPGKADLWDSGKMSSDQSVLVEYAGKRLASAQRAYWKVRIWGTQGDGPIDSTPAFFEMGLLERSQWKGKWIGSSNYGSAYVGSPAPYVRKSFSLDKPIASARLYATALGLYEASLNGKRVGDDVFTPGWTDYHKRVQYQVYDVTSMLHQGKNAIGAVLGDGWYCGYVGNFVYRQFMGDRPKFLAQLVVRHTDGTSTVVSTGPDWKILPGPIVESDLMMGETYDARREIPGWDTAEYPEAKGAAVEVFDDPGMAIVATPGPTVRRIEEVHPVAEPKKVAQWGRDAYLVDLGQNMVGRVRLKVTGPAGVTVTLRFVEVLKPDGTIYTDNLRKAKQTDRYTLKGGGEEIYESHFTFHGFRYVEVDAYPGTFTTDSITGIVLHSDTTPTGTFECSDPLVNQLQHNIQWGQKGNFVDVPTDCPQRDERLGWTGDAQVFIRTAAFNMDVAGFFTKWIQDLRDSQGDNGTFPSFAPKMENPHPGHPEWGRDGGPAWADAGVICPWTIYLCYGDRRVLEQHFESAKKYIGFLHRTSKGNIRCIPEAHAEGSWDGYGDWLSINADSPKDILGTAFLAYSSGLVSKMAKVLGKEDDAAKYAKIFEDTRKAFIDRFVTKSGLMVGQTQTAYILALHFGLLPEEMRATAADLLVRDIRGRQNRLSSGFVGTVYLNHVLSANGKHDVAYELLFQKNWPSWLYAVTQGATTIWERWDGWTHDKGFQDAGMNSFNHYAYGAIGDWLYQVVAGIDVDPQRPGYKHILLRPRPGKGLDHARATLESLYGKIVSGWQVDGEKFKWDVTVPPNTTATARIPAKDPAAVQERGKSLKDVQGVKAGANEKGAAVVELSPGTYQFTSTIPGFD